MFRGGLYVTFSRTSQVFGKRGSHRADKPANEERIAQVSPIDL
jgi:hypothetical protein